jgi:Family of unknown function (DUF5329)
MPSRRREAAVPGPSASPLGVRDRRMRRLLWVLVLSIGAFAHAADATSLESQKISYLIASIETLQGAQFIRNDTAYNAKAAADHLRLKLRMAGSRVVTADDFIRLCASVSSVSGIPYQIRFADGRVVSSEAFLRQKLSEFKP